jgi:hypothetical protein
MSFRQGAVTATVTLPSPPHRFVSRRARPHAAVGWSRGRDPPVRQRRWSRQCTWRSVSRASSSTAFHRPSFWLQRALLVRSVYALGEPAMARVNSAAASSYCPSLNSFRPRSRAAIAAGDSSGSCLPVPPDEKRRLSNTLLLCGPMRRLPIPGMPHAPVERIESGDCSVSRTWREANVTVRSADKGESQLLPSFLFLTQCWPDYQKREGRDLGVVVDEQFSGVHLQPWNVNPVHLPDRVPDSHSSLNGRSVWFEDGDYWHRGGATILESESQRHLVLGKQSQSVGKNVLLGS